MLAAGAFNVWEDDRFVATAVFLGAIPLLTTTILVIWMSQILGMLAVGEYLSTLEVTIRRGLPQAPGELMTWEEKVWTSQMHWWPPNYASRFIAVLGLFALLTLASIVLGSYRAWDGHETETLLGALAISSAFAAVCWGVAAAVRNARRSKRDSETEQQEAA